MRAWVTVSFEAEPDETDEDLAALTGELAGDLREVGDIDYVPVEGETDGKGVGEVVAATLAVLTVGEPGCVQALVETVVAFLRRHEGRRARLRVGEVRLSIDQPTRGEVEQMIELTRLAIERSGERGVKPDDRHDDRHDGKPDGKPDGRRDGKRDGVAPTRR